MTDSQIPAPDPAQAPQEAPEVAPASQADSQPVEASPVDTAPQDAPPVDAPAAAPVAQPVTVDQRTKRSDDDALQGHACQVVDGEHAGQVGVFLQPVTTDPETGYPLEILIRFKNTNYSAANATVPYDAVRPAEHPGSQ